MEEEAANRSGSDGGEQCSVITCYCNSVTVIILLLSVMSGVTDYK